MLIRSKILREGGTKVTLDATEYHFKPRPGTSAHVCDVLDKHHVNRFLAISEGYELFDTELTTSPAKATKTEAPRAAAIADDDDDDDLGDDFSDDLAPIAGPDAATAPDAGDDFADAADADDAAEEGAADDEPENEPSDADLTAEKIDALDEDDLRAAYAVHNGRAAPVNTKPETIREKLKELIAA